MSVCVLPRACLPTYYKVVFTSTGGTSRGAHGLLLRDSLFDESIHVPLIMRHPALLPRKLRSKVPVSTIDVAPTILDLVSGGSSVDPHTGFTFGVDGLSLVPLIDAHQKEAAAGQDGDSDSNSNHDGGDGSEASSSSSQLDQALLDRATISTDGRTTFAVRTKDRKLVLDLARQRGDSSSDSSSSSSSGSGSSSASTGLDWTGVALYNLRDDACETTNVVAPEEARGAHESEVRDLLGTLHDFLEYIDFHGKDQPSARWLHRDGGEAGASDERLQRGFAGRGEKEEEEGEGRRRQDWAG
jgi:hypothetical protein